MIGFLGHPKPVFIGSRPTFSGLIDIGIKLDVWMCHQLVEHPFQTCNFGVDHFRVEDKSWRFCDVLTWRSCDVIVWRRWRWCCRHLSTLVVHFPRTSGFFRRSPTSQSVTNCHKSKVSRRTRSMKVTNYNYNKRHNYTIGESHYLKL